LWSLPFLCSALLHQVQFLEALIFAFRAAYQNEGRELTDAFGGGSCCGVVAGEAFRWGLNAGALLGAELLCPTGVHCSWCVLHGAAKCYFYII